MGFFDSISEAVSNITGGLGDQVNGAVEDATSQVPGADQVQDVADQVQQTKEDILPAGESNNEE